jgi:hypothetical protein
VTEPLKQLPHVRTWIGADGVEHSESLISQGFEARRHKLPLAQCPYSEKEDPDGRSWWHLGWHRCDMHELRTGRGSMLKGVRLDNSIPRKLGGPTLGIK